MNRIVPLGVLLSVNLACTKSRPEQVEACKGCHADVYAKWAAGPHGQAYAQLVKYRAKLVSHGLEGKRPHEFASQDDFCSKCHAPSNMFETILALSPPANIVNKVIGQGGGTPTARKEFRDLGVDCLTCHVKEGQVYTRADFKPREGAGDSCDPQPSASFAKDYSCYPCHGEESALQERLRYTSKDDSVNCIRCHGQRDGKGRWDHAFPWAGMIEQGTVPPPLERSLGLIQTRTATTGKRELAVEWVDTEMIHEFSPVTEVVVEISIAGASGTPVFQAVERTNRKKVHMNGKEDWGGKASTFQFGAGHGLKKHYPIPAGLPEKVVASVAVRRKSQYFLPDESFPPVFRRDFPLDLSTLPAQ